MTICILFAATLLACLIMYQYEHRVKKGRLNRHAMKYYATNNRRRLAKY